MAYTIKEGLAYSDVLLVPQFSTISSRATVSTTVTLNNFEFAHPFITSNMKDISGYEMGRFQISNGGLFISHRFYDDIYEQINVFQKLKSEFSTTNKQFSISIGVKPTDLDIAKEFLDVGGEIITIDIAHGDSSHCLNMITLLKKYHSHSFVIAGNIATGTAYKRLADTGADCIKSGVGGGSVCSTRLKTGNGVPMFTCISEIAEMKDKYNYKIPFIADGGVSDVGHSAIALCFSDIVMMGSAFAGTDEAPGENRIIDGVTYKSYAGSSTYKIDNIEGFKGLVKSKGSAKEVLNKYLQGLRSCCSYQGVEHISLLKDNPQFVNITTAGIKESGAHDLDKIVL